MFESANKDEISGVGCERLNDTRKLGNTYVA